MNYKKRHYRQNIRAEGLITFNVRQKESDLLISARSDLTLPATQIVSRYRKILENYIKSDPFFKETFLPYKVAENVPQIVREMADNSAQVGVGPMAAVAGAFAEYVGVELLKYSPEVIVENGGDDYIATERPRTVAIFAGQSSLSMKFGIKVEPADSPLGICTSSGTIGPSFSFGTADAVVVVSKSTLLADAAATAIGNIVKGKDDIQKALDFAKTIKNLKGVVVILGDKMGLLGDIEIVNLI